MIPMTDTVYVIKPDTYDRWGNVVADTISVHKCRIDFNVERKTTTSGGFKSSDEVVYTASMLFKGLVQISYDDILQWTDDFGNVQEEKPINIVPIKDISGKVILTEVLV